MDFFSDRIPSLILIAAAITLGLSGWIVNKRKSRWRVPPEESNHRSADVPEFHLDERGYPPDYQPRQRVEQSSTWLQQLLRRRKTFDQTAAPGDAGHQSVTQLLTDRRANREDPESQSKEPTADR